MKKKTYKKYINNEKKYEIHLYKGWANYHVYF